MVDRSGTAYQVSDDPPIQPRNGDTEDCAQHKEGGVKNKDKYFLRPPRREGDTKDCKELTKEDTIDIGFV